LLYEARVVWKDKSVRWVRVEGKVLYDDDGKACRVLGIILDTTEQRNAKENQQKLISLVDNSVDLVCILDLDGVNSYMNEAGCILLGYTDENEVAQIPISQLQAQNHFDLFESEIIPTVITEGKWSGTMMVRHLQTGEVFPVYNNCFRIDDPVSGMPISIGAVMRDMRPELAVKQALEDSEQLLRNITDATPIALWMSDEDGAFTYINKTWLDWSGQNYVENLGDGWQNVVIEKDRERVIAKLENALLSKISYEAEFRIHHSDGTVHWCIANGQPQYRNDGSFSGYIGACVDISEQKALQQQKDDFIGIASHELKTPVTSIKGYAQILEKMLLKKGDDKEAMMMGRMDNQIKRLTSLINDLLDVTKINSGKLQFNYLAFEFNDMVKEMTEDLQRTTENHTLQEELGEPAVVYGDKERIGQVITNLISNAIKYSPDSQKIVIRTSTKDNEVILSVEDYGIGIPADKLEKVFEQFYRVSGDMQHTFPGLGLGLYISSEIIKRVNGRIWVTSREGEGSVFCIALPVLNENYHEETKKNTDS
jgi:PAS domain S-box-containing protein